MIQDLHSRFGSMRRIICGLPPGVCLWGRPGSASCTVQCGTARLVTSGLGQAFAQTGGNKRKANRLTFILIRTYLKISKDNKTTTRTTHMGSSILIAEHVWVRGHNWRPRLLRHTGRLRSCFAMVYQLLHGVCDAFITCQSRMGNIKLVLKWQNLTEIIHVFLVQWNKHVYTPSLKGLLPNCILLRLCILIEMQTQLLRVFLISSCKTQLHNTLIETHYRWWRKFNMLIISFASHCV